MRAQFVIILSCLLAACGNKASSDAIENPLEGRAGNAVEGAVKFASRESGHCVLCHMVDGLGAEFQGNLGPDLSAVGSRLTPAQLRLRIVDYDRVVAGTTMPSYYRTEELNQVAPEFAGKTLLSAQDIEDIIAYLSSLKDSEL